MSENPGRTRIAAVLTCYNRVEKTLACLESLAGQAVAVGADVRVYVVDDASSDGTADQVRSRFPDAKVIPGTGELFWSGGMRLALAHAMDDDHDHYLWMNDDVVLDPDALAVLLATYGNVRSANGDSAIIVGSVRDPLSGELTYGGVRRLSRLRPVSFGLVHPQAVPVPCDTMNGNVVLVPRSVARVVGNIDAAYSHSLGDLDYGLRAQGAGCAVWVAPETVGTCERNPPHPYGKGTIAEEVRLVRSPKGLPLSAWRVFVRRWGGPAWVVFFVLPYLRRTVRGLRARLARASP